MSQDPESAGELNLASPRTGGFRGPVASVRRHVTREVFTVGNRPVRRRIEKRRPRMSDSAPVPGTQRTSGERDATWPATHPSREPAPTRRTLADGPGIESPELPPRHEPRAGEPTTEAGPVPADAAMAGPRPRSLPPRARPCRKKAPRNAPAQARERTVAGRAEGERQRRAGCPGAILEAAEARSRERRIELRGRMRYTGTTTTSR